MTVDEIERIVSDARSKEGSSQPTRFGVGWSVTAPGRMSSTDRGGDPDEASTRSVLGALRSV